MTDPALVRLKDSRYKLASWSGQLAALLTSGVPLIRSLDVLASQVEDPLFGKVLEDVSRRVTHGFQFSKALSAYPLIFSPVFVGLVRSGESSGLLNECVGRLAKMLERESALQKRLISALTYPLFVLALTGVLTLFVFYAIMPNFINIFRDQHLELPLITRFLVVVTDAIRRPGAWMLFACLGLNFYIGLQSLSASEQGACRLFKLLLKIPVLGSILQLSSLARYCWVMDSVLGSGLPLLRCLKIASAACGNPVIKQDGEILTGSLQEGSCTLSQHFRANSHIYKPVMSDMITAGEESAGLDSAFGRLAVWFSQDMDDKLDLLTATFEPFLMGLVATLVGAIVIGIFLPLYGLVGNLGS